MEKTYIRKNLVNFLKEKNIAEMHGFRDGIIDLNAEELEYEKITC